MSEETKRVASYLGRKGDGSFVKRGLSPEFVFVPNRINAHESAAAYELAARLGCRALVVMPTTTPQVKIEAVKARGEMSLIATDLIDALTAAARRIQGGEY